jgi:NAD(P)H-dependent flavin oxidoreductase YrpB (nitropropane dioxygenase family)
LFQTAITNLFGIRYPIAVGTMMHLSCSEMVAAAANAGALGILASSNSPTRERFRDELKKIHDLTDRPYAVNLNFFPARKPVDNREYLEVLASEGVRIVETSGHRAPEDLIAEIKKAGIVLVHKCVGVRYALKAQEIGADAVTVVGYENGGATGQLDITTLCLVPRVADAVSIPVIGGGGVADGRGFLALLALGAQGVIMGTPFLVAEECPLHRNLKEAIIGAAETDTTLVMRTIQNTHRVWVNEAAKRVAELESRGAGLQEIVQAASGKKAKEMYQEGHLHAGVMACGQGVGLVRKIRPMKDIVEDIVHQADDLRRRLAGI